MITWTYNNIDYNFRNPVFGNEDQLSFQRINRKTQGGDLTIFRDNDWPKTEVLKLIFSFDKESDRNYLLEFVRLSTGQIVQYRDHENRLWEGFITNPGTEVVQSGKNAFVIEILFEGDLV